MNRRVLKSSLVLLLVINWTPKIYISKIFQGFSPEKVVIGEEKFKKGDDSLLIKRHNKNEVYLSFLEEFNDTLTMEINDKIVKKWSMYSDSNKNPRYKSFDTLLYVKRKTKIVIKLNNQKKCAIFSIDNRCPYITVQRFNNVWYVNYRKYVLVSK